MSFFLMMALFLIMFCAPRMYAAEPLTTQAELQAAINNAAAGDTIMLTQDIEISGSALVLPDKALTLDGGGFNLTLADGYTGRHITATNLKTADYTFLNLNFIGHNTDIPTQDTVASRTNGGGVDFRMVKFDPSTMVLHFSDCSFTGLGWSGNSSDGFGSAIHTEPSTSNQASAVISISDCIFKNNSAYTAAGIYTKSRTTLNIEDVTFSGNYAAAYGGGIRLDGTSTANLTNVSFLKNNAAYGGGAISSEATSTNLNAVNCLFEENTAGNGGAVQGGSSVQKMYFEGCTFRSNTATSTSTGNGGGAICGNGIETLNSDFINNTSGADGGAIRRINTGTCTVKGGKFTGNSAGKFGGAISGSAFYFIYADQPPQQIIDGAEFDDNFAGMGYLYIDFDHPVQSSTGTPPIYGTVENRYQATAKEWYDIYYPNITTWSEGPVEGYTSKNIINNYDVETRYFSVDILRGEAEWSDGNTTAQRAFTWQSSDTIENHLKKAGLSLIKDGYIITGWTNHDNFYKGYTEEEAIVGSDYYIRGAMQISPIWAEAVDVVYHYDSVISKPDVANPYAVDSEVMVKALSAVDESWIAPADSVFLGWATSETPSEDELLYSTGDTFTITADTDLYARFAVVHTVTFDTDGGSTVASQEVVDGKKVTKPENPSKEGFLFGGWYADEDKTLLWDFEVDVVTADTIIYAKWTTLSEEPPIAYTGNLEITKTVVNNNRAELTAEQLKKEFRFTVTFSNLQQMPVTVFANGRLVELTAADCTIVFKLKHGETMLLRNVPANTTYTVKETPVDGYTMTVKGEQGVVASGDTVRVSYVNQYEASKNPDKNKPQTGDTSLTLLLGIMLLSLACTIAVVMSRLRTRGNYTSK